MNFRACSFLELPERPYVLEILVLEEASFLVAVGSDFNIYLAGIESSTEFKLTPLQKIEAAHSNRITGLVKNPLNHFQFWTCSLNGCIKLWDTRANWSLGKDSACVSTIFAPNGYPLTCLSCSADGICIAAGTELVGEDAHILFWNIKDLISGSGAGARLILDYTESHQDDLTLVKFHPALCNIFFSGSVDGLVCVFDLNVANGNEDDSLQRVLNSGSSVSQINIFGPEGAYVSVLTHIETMSLWNWQSGDCIKQFGDFREGLEIDEEQPAIHPPLKNSLSRPRHYAVSSAFDPQQQKLYLFTGAQNGEIQINDVTLNSITTHDYSQKGEGHSDIVRSIAWRPGTEILFSGGEDGRVVLWRLHFK